MSLIEVVAHVKTGGLLPRLSEAMCSVDVTDLIIEACMSPFPASRPTFRALYSDLIFFGGSEDDVAIQESKKRRMRANADAPEILSCEEKLSRQGPSVHHLQTTFLSGVLNAVESELASFDGLTQASDAAIFHMVKAYAKPTGEFDTCPRDGMVGAAYVDTLNGMDNVGLATALLSYSWGYKVKLRRKCLPDLTNTLTHPQTVCHTCLLFIPLSEVILPPFLLSFDQQATLSRPSTRCPNQT